MKIREMYEVVPFLISCHSITEDNHHKKVKCAEYGVILTFTCATGDVVKFFIAKRDTDMRIVSCKFYRKF